MTTERSTYTYEGGERETVTLKRGPATPHGHALLKIEYDDGPIGDCYVNTAWLRDRLNDLDPRPLTPDAITAAMVKRGFKQLAQMDNDGIPLRNARAVRQVLEAALTEPPARPEGAETLAFDLDEAHKGGGDVQDEADRLYAMGYRKTGGN